MPVKRPNLPEMDGSLEAFASLLQSPDSLQVLDAHALHVLGSARIDVSVGLLDGLEGVVLPEE